MNSRENISYYSYYQILNKTMIRNKTFHFLLNLLDTFILLIKILDIFQTNYNTNLEKTIKYLKPAIFFLNKPTLIRLLPLIIYLFLGYLISILYLFSNVRKKVHQIDVIIMNFFEFGINRLFFIFYNEFLFSLSSFYFLIFLILSLPFVIFIFLDMTFFHLTDFMLQMIVFPFDDFTSLCDRQIVVIKILVSISSVTKSYYICKLMFFLQFILYICCSIYNTYIIFYKSYYLMNNEFITKTKYSNILGIVVTQIFMLFMEPEEIFKMSFIIIFFFIIIFPNIFIFLFYNPYNYIIIDRPDNRENLFYYFFLIDRNKNVTFFLEEKIKAHIYKCDYCPLCDKYKRLMEVNKVIEFENEKIDNNENDMFNILYNGKDKSMIISYHIINNIKKLGNNCLYNNSYYIINLIYIFYYSYKIGDFTLALNQLLLFNLIIENNQSLITSHSISIKQILYINKFFILYKKILSQIKEIISKNNFKKYYNKFFLLSKNLTLLKNSKFKENLYGSKNEGITNYNYSINICSLLYEEIFNKTLSGYSIPIRENAQLHEDIIKNFAKENNNITLKFNLKTLECKIINAGKELFYYMNNNFYDLFPNQIKEILIQNFCDIILKAEHKQVKQVNRNSKQSSKQYIEPVLLVQIPIDNIKFYRILNLKLILLLNDFMSENILLSGSYYINQNILVTSNKGNKEKICGFGNKEIMSTIFNNKLNYNRFLESDFMRNKVIYVIYSISINNINFNVHNIMENKRKKKKTERKGISKKSTTLKENTHNNNKDTNIETNLNLNDATAPNQEENENNVENTNNDEENSNDKSSNDMKYINDILEETASQSSKVTKSSANSFFNLNKTISRNDQNKFSSKKFLNLQILLGGLLVTLLTLMILLILQIKLLQETISTFCENYFDLHQFVRTFHQFSYAFLTMVCLVKTDPNSCEEYLSSLDSKEFNQTLFLSEQNEILAEYCSNSANKIIANSETVHDEKLLSLFKGNISYNIINIKKSNSSYSITNSAINISFSDSLLLLSNNMRIIMSPESKIKTRPKEPIYLVSGLESPFDNIKNKADELSDYQISVYTYLINYKTYVQNFASLSQRLNELINLKNKRLINIVNIFHNIIFVVMIFQIVVILFYLFTYNKILAQILNSIFIKFDLVFDDENDFKKLYKIKISHLDEIINVYAKNPIISINDINNNYAKYKSLLSNKKKNEQRLNINKKQIKEEDENILFKDSQKYVNWIDIYNGGYDRFYLIFSIVITIISIAMYAIVFIVWDDYRFKSESTLELIYYSWNFERNTLRLVNFYNTMIFNNQTLDDIKNDYFSSNEYSAIENIHQVLYSYYELRKKRQKISSIYRGFRYFCDYNCHSLYSVMNSIEDSSFSATLKIMKQKYNIKTEDLLEDFENECGKTQSFIGNSVSPSFQNLYQKMTDAMILFHERTYDTIIKKIFNSSHQQLSSTFLNVTRYIIYIVGKITYTDATNTMIEKLGHCIVITLILYILSECSLFIFFFFVYIWNMNCQCKNMFKLKSVFEITNSIE